MVSIRPPLLPFAIRHRGVIRDLCLFRSSAALQESVRHRFSACTSRRFRSPGSTAASRRAAASGQRSVIPRKDQTRAAEGGESVEDRVNQPAQDRTEQHDAPDRDPNLPIERQDRPALLRDGISRLLPRERSPFDVHGQVAEPRLGERSARFSALRPRAADHVQRLARPRPARHDRPRVERIDRLQNRHRNVPRTRPPCVRSL